MIFDTKPSRYLIYEPNKLIKLHLESPLAFFDICSFSSELDEIDNLIPRIILKPIALSDLDILFFKLKDKYNLVHFVTNNLPVGQRLPYIYNILEKSKKYGIKILFREKTDIFRLVSSAYKVHLIAPECVSVDICDECNTNCIYCWSHSFLNSNKSSDNRVSIEMFKKYVDILHIHGCEWIEFAGMGEPFMHPDIISMLEYVANKNLSVIIYTNGLLLNKELILRLVELRVGLRVNLSASNYKTYSKIHPYVSEEKYTRLMTLLNYFGALCKKNNLPYMFSTENVMCDFNFREIGDILELSNKIGCSEATFNIFSSITETDELKIKDMSQLIDVVKNNQNHKLNNNLKSYLKMLIDKNLKNNYCYMMWFYARLLTDGTILPCYDYPETKDYFLKNSTDVEIKQCISDTYISLNSYPLPESSIKINDFCNLIANKKNEIPFCNVCMNESNLFVHKLIENLNHKGA